MEAKKGEIRKNKRLCEIELENSVKDSKHFFKYFSNNKKQKSSIGPLHEEYGEKENWVEQGKW